MKSLRGQKKNCRARKKNGFAQTVAHDLALPGAASGRQVLEAGVLEKAVAPSPVNAEKTSRHIASTLTSNPVVHAGATSGEVSFPPASGSVEAGGKMEREDDHCTATLEQQDLPGVLAIGARVRMHSLQLAPEHNGVLGEIVKHNLAKGRWYVKTSSGGVILLKPSNLTLVAAEEAAGSQDGRSEHGHPSPQQVRLDMAKTHWKKGLLRKALSIYVAIPNGHLEIAKVVQGAGGRELLLATDIVGHTCLHYAAHDGCVEIAKVLLDAGSSELCVLRNADGHSCLHIAAKECNLEVVKAVVEVGGHTLYMLTDELGYSCLHVAVHYGHLEVVKALVDACGRELLMLPNKQGLSCLLLATAHEQVEVVKLLVELGGRELLLLHANGFSSLCFADRAGNREILSVLEEAYKHIGLLVHEVAIFRKDLTFQLDLVERLKTRQSNPPGVQEAASGAASVCFHPSFSSGGKVPSEHLGSTLNTEKPATPGALAMGAMVRMHSLQAAPEHNGMLGQIVGRDLAKDRWYVKKDVSTVNGCILLLKPSNLTLVSRATAAI